MKRSILLIFVAAAFALSQRGVAEEDKVVTEVPVHVGKITKATLHSYVTAYGTVEPEPATKDKPAAGARVASPFAGVVSEANCYEGQEVKKGDLLFRLDSRAAEVVLKKAQQAADFAERNLERQKKLLKIEGTSQKAYQQAEQDLSAAKSELATAETQAKLLRIETPVAGTVVRVNVRAGESVDVNSVLAEVIDFSRLVITANVPSDEAAEIKIGTAAIISAGTKSATGKVSFVSSHVDSKTGTVLVRVSVAPDSGLRSGQFVNLQIVADERKDTLAAPVASLIKNGDGKPAIAVVEGDRATQKEVKVGIRENGLVEVQGEGLKEGMGIVTAGAYGLPAETKIRVIAE